VCKGRRASNSRLHMAICIGGPVTKFIEATVAALGAYFSPRHGLRPDLVLLRELQSRAFTVLQKAVPISGDCSASSDDADNERQAKTCA